MSSIKKVNTSRKRQAITPSRDAFLGSKNIRFHHQSVEDDTTIDLTSLNGWIAGVSNPNPQQLANVFAFRNNLVLKSSTREYELVQGQDYQVLGTIITFLNGYAALEDEQFFGSIILPSSNIIASESKTEVMQYVLSAGQTVLPVGATFEVGANGSQQIGAIKVYRDGKLQLRCVGNDISNVGNYIEIDSGNGFGSSIQFKSVNALSDDGVVVDFGVHQVADVNVFSDLERLSGIALQLSNDVAQLTGNPVTDYMNASASETDRLTLSNTVLDHGNRLDDIEAGEEYTEKILTSSVTTNTTDVADLRFNNLEIGKYYILSGQVDFRSTSADNMDLSFRSEPGAGTLYGRITAGFTAASGGTVIKYGVNVIFQATSTTMYCQTSSIGGGSELRGTDKTQTFLQLREANVKQTNKYA